MRCANNTFILKAPNGKYIKTPDGHGELYTKTDDRIPKGVFAAEEQDTGLFIIKSVERVEATGRGYWVGTNGVYGLRILAISKGGMGTWDKFRVLNQDDGSVVFKTFHDRYVNLEVYEGDKMRMVGKSTIINQDTKFIPECV